MSQKFVSTFKKFRTKTMFDANEFRKALNIRLQEAIIKDTPVDNGILIASWRTTTGAPSTDMSERKDKSGNVAIQEARENQGEMNDTVYFINNMPYAMKIEFGGSRKNNGEGMVRKNLARAQGMARAALARWRG